MTLTEEELKELEDEVNELDDFGGDEFDSEEAVKEDDNAEDEEVVENAEEKSAEDVVEESVKESEEVVNEETVVEKPIKENPVVDDVAELRKLVDTLNQQIFDLKSQGPKKESAEEPKKNESAAEKTPEKSEVDNKPFEYKDIDFIGELDMDDVSADKNILNQILNNAAKTIIEQADKAIRTSTVKDTLLAIPNVITSQIQTQSYITNAVERFYTENPDLAEVKSTVGQVAMNIAAEHPEYDLETLYKEAASSTRKLLRLPDASDVIANKGNQEEFKNPAFSKPGGKRSKPAKVSDLQRELDEL